MCVAHHEGKVSRNLHGFFLSKLLDFELQILRQ
jgi:hypothetical protein